jgi:peptide/nickel transport system substrate-binding protein
MRVWARPRGQASRWLVSLVVLALAAACAPGAPSSTAQKPSAAPAAEPGAQAGAPAGDRVVRGGTFAIGIHQDLLDFDTMTVGGGIKLAVMGLVQSGLLKWGKTTVVDHSKVTCDLCESWSQLDPVTYEFKLRQGVRWHNVPPVNGREFVADDVKYTLERLLTGNFRNDPRFARMAARVATIASIETPDRYTVRFYLKSPDAVFLWNMGDPFLLMVAREQVEAEPDGILQTGVIGTGPFILKEFTPKVSYTLVRNPDYFIPGLPYLDRIEVRNIPDNITRFNAFRAKELHDPGQSMTAEDKRIVERQHPDLFMGEVPGMTVSSARFNTTQPPFDDARVRRAIHLAIDRQGIVDATRFGRAELIRWLPPAMGLVATPAEEVAKLPGYRQPKDEDLATARRLLAEAGHSNGFATELKANRASSIPADAEVLVEQLRRNLNLDVKLLVLENAVYQRDFQGRNYRMAIDYGLSAVGDADETLSQLVSTSGANTGQWKNARFDELYPRQRMALDPVERARVIGEMLTILDDEAPVVTLYADLNYRGYPKGCHGIQQEHRYNVLLRYMSEVWCEEGVLRK